MTNPGLAAKAGRNLAALAIFFAVLAVAARGGAATAARPSRTRWNLPRA